MRILSIVLCALFATASAAVAQNADSNQVRELKPIPVVGNAISIKSDNWDETRTHGASAAEVAELEVGMSRSEVDSILTGNSRRTSKEKTEDGLEVEVWSWEGNGGEDSEVIVRFEDDAAIDFHARNLADELPPWLEPYSKPADEREPESVEEDEPLTRDGDYVSLVDFNRIRIGFSERLVERILPGEGKRGRVFEYLDILYKEYVWEGNGVSGESRAVVVFRGENVVDAYYIDLH